MNETTSSSERPTVIMYTTPTCVYCRMAKDFFKAHNVDYREINVLIDTAAQEEMIKKSGQLGVPVIDVKGEIIVGFDEEHLRSLLGIQ